MHSGFAAYFFESLGGIKATHEAPGYKEFTVNPIFPKYITKTSVNVPTPYGTIYNSWETNESNFLMNLKVPFNTKARVILSIEELKSLKINGDTLEKFQKTNKAEIINSSVLVFRFGELPY